MNNGPEILEKVMNLHRCEDCQIRCKAKSKPDSLSAKLHGWHKTWWPGWKIYQAELRSQRPNPSPQV
jgi:hypothetical protein